MAKKVRVRFVGTAPAALLSNSADYGSIQFQRYGQLVELDEDVYIGIVSGHYGAKLALIPDEEFRKLGHTDTELVKHGGFESHSTASADFLKRRDTAMSIMERYHSSPPKASKSETPTKKE